MALGQEPGNRKALYVTLMSCTRTGYRGRDRNTIKGGRSQVVRVADKVGYDKRAGEG